MRLLLWVAVIVVVLLWLQHSKKARLKTQVPPRRPETGDAAEAMVQCAHCGVHLPASEAVGNPAGSVFCSEEHRAQHRA